MSTRPFPRFLLVLCWLFLPVLLSACEQGRKQRQTPIPTVSFVELAPETVTLRTELPGRVSAFLVAEVRPQVGGIVLERRFTEGAEVKAGDILYIIDPRPFRVALANAQAALAEARAGLSAAKATEARYRPLVAQKAVSPQDYDNAKAARAQHDARVLAAQAAVEAAALDLAYTEVKAPVSGRIGKSSVTPGALVTQNQATPLATVQGLDQMYVDLTQSSAQWLALRERLASGTLRKSQESAQPHLILENGHSYTAADGTPIPGRLQFADVTVTQDTGSLTLRALFPNPDNLLLPGMYVRAVLEEGVRDQAILVPQRAVRHDNRGQPVAWVLAPAEDDTSLCTLERRTLTVDRAIKGRWLVLSGLQAGDKIMVDGPPRLAPGQKARATPYLPDSEHSPAPKQ